MNRLVPRIVTVWVLCCAWTQNCKGHDTAAVGEYWSLLWVTEELYEPVPLRRCITITWDGGEDRGLLRRCCKDGQITQQRQSDRQSVSISARSPAHASQLCSCISSACPALPCLFNRQKYGLAKRGNFLCQFNELSYLTDLGRMMCRRDLHSLLQWQRQQVVKLGGYVSAPYNLIFDPLTAQKWSTEILNFLNM